MAVRGKQPKFSVAVQSPTSQEFIRNTLQDPKRIARFVAGVTSAVTVNPALQQCTVASILSAALLGETLELSPSPQLGHYYLVPFKSKATFIMGYKGYIQLALRSGFYKNLIVVGIKAGEFRGYDPFTETIKVDLIQDPVAREVAKSIGYYAKFTCTNGFEKSMYWSREAVEKHGKQYSKAYHTADSFWKKDFDVMAYKTLLRQLLGKWGILSIEMRQAIEADDTIIDTTGTVMDEPATGLPEPLEEPITESQMTPEGAVAREISLGDL